MTTLAVLLAGLAVLAAAWIWSVRAADAVVGVTVSALLATLATVFNVVVPVADVEATTTVVVCVSLVLGVRMSVLVAVLAVIGTGAAAGLGTWTGWQVAGFVLVATGARLARPALDLVRDPATQAWAIAALAGVLTLMYDTVTTVATVQLTGTQVAGGFWSSAGSLLLLGVPFTATHVVGNVVIARLLAPPLVLALERARVRIDVRQSAHV
jgi:energy-coupling factor transport system substrate-specific component